MFENRVLRRIFEPKRDEESEKWRKLYNWEISDMYSLPNTYYSGEQIKKNELGGARNTCGGIRHAYRILVGKPLGTPRRRLDGNVKIDLQEMVSVSYTGLIWLRIGRAGLL